MSVVDILETEFRLKDNYSGAAKNVTASTQGLSQVMGGASAVAAGFNSVLAVATVAIAGLAAGTKIAFEAFKQGAAFENLQISLKAVEGNATSAAEAMKRLKEIAKMPGIGLEEAIRGYTGLRRNNIGADDSERLVKAAGNANAYAGGSIQTFESMMRAFTQIAGKPYLSGEELMQLNEAGLPATRMITEKFGTADGGELKKMNVTSAMAIQALIEAMEDIADVAGGSQNALDNFNSSVKFAVIDFGQSFNESFLPVLEEVSGVLDELVENGYFKNLAQSLKDTVAAFGGVDLGEQLKSLAAGIAVAAEVAKSSAEAAKAGNQGLEKFTLTDDIAKFFADVIKNRFKQMIEGKDGLVPNDPYDKNKLDAAQAENDAFFKKLGYDPEKIKAQKDAQEKVDRDAQKEADAKLAKEKEDSPAVRILKKIEENTKVMPDLKEAIMGGGELARLGISAVDIRGTSRREKVVRNAEILFFESAASMNRRLRRAGV
jgi:tape measure domain-containing protein